MEQTAAAKTATYAESSILLAVVLAAEKLWARGPVVARLVGGVSIALGGFFSLRAAAVF